MRLARIGAADTGAMGNLNLPFEIEGYRIVRRLGLGGMATVYLGIQRSLGRPVAIKVLATDHTQSEELVKRFEHEARTIARLDHPHIVNIFDVGRTSSGQIYYTMPYLPNGDLAARNLREDQQRILAIIRALADALGYAHEQGIVHRDVKPENVLFDKLDRPLLADFGIAISDTHQPRVTREGATIGSSGYMSPEQARSQPLDGRSDIYSLGVLCYELLTGEMPFRGPDTLSVALAHIENPVPRLPMLRRVWQPFIDKSMSKRPEARFQSAEEVLAALDAIEQRITAPPAHGPARWWRALAERTAAVPRRTRALVIGLLISIALASLIVLLPHAPGPPAAAPSANAAPVTPEAAAAPSENVPAIATPPTAETPAPPAEPVIDNAAIEAMLDEAKDLAAHGHSFAPKGKNAAERYLAALRADPNRHEATRGIEGLYAPLAATTKEAIDRGDVDAASTSIEHATTTAEAAKLKKSKALDSYRDTVGDAIDKRRQRGHGPFDAGQLAPLANLVPALEKLDAKTAEQLKADLARPAKLLRDGGKFRDKGGPELAMIPVRTDLGDHLDYAFALGTTDVTRTEYERFAKATGRPPARCRESQSLFARFREFTWDAPGFDQTGDHPVVCVSWQDAKAYTEWLSRKTDEHYRLPTQQEWMHVAQAIVVATGCGGGNFSPESCDDGFANTSPVGRFPATRFGLFDVVGNVAVWTADCSVPPLGGECRTHVIRGLSWRDERDPAQVWREETSVADMGYTTIGFRVLREISADNARLAKNK
ncbi:MAG TPA: bifunctional serine/threonine-protein kinase/formylglycine-generating enzyme family protein [Rhodanobacteraceae bacterium]|nr:bifunctional serine/threonine-protein kinase/formylglycine-generating enzyme family protein [Rhodanobacteraceae bacterium]